MNIDLACRGACAGLSFAVVLVAAPCAAAPLTLEEAWTIAERANPALRSVVARRDAAIGERTDASALLFNNPDLSGEVGRRRIEDGSETGTANDWGVGLSQTFEIAGQHAARRDAAERTAAAVEQEIAEARRQLRAEVERRFVEVLALQTRIELEERSAALIESTAAIVRKRVTAGEDSRLDGNLASVEAERARNQLAVLQEELIRARAALGALLQTPDKASPEAIGALDPVPRPYGLEELLADVAQRPALHALDLRLQAAKRHFDLERAARYPDVTVGLRQWKEGALNGKDTITGLTLSVPLPIFRRNAAGIGRAASEQTQAEIDRLTFERDARAQVVALWEQRRKLEARVQRLRESVQPRLEENQRLSESSLRAGAIGLSDWILAQRQVLEGQRDLVDARTGLRLTQVDLEAAAGWPPSAFAPTSNGER